MSSEGGNGAYLDGPPALSGPDRAGMRSSTIRRFSYVTRDARLRSEIGRIGGNRMKLNEPQGYNVLMVVYPVCTRSIYQSRHELFTRSIPVLTSFSYVNINATTTFDIDKAREETDVVTGQ